MIRYPKNWDLPTGTFDNVAGLQDIMPTILEAAGAAPPPEMTGQSLLAAIRGEPWRDVFHGEHSPCYAPDNAMQYLTDGREKYIYYPVTRAEQLFDLQADRQELHDLAADPAHAGRLAAWRQRLIDRLGRRGDGFSDGTKLLRKEPGFSPIVAGHPANPPA